MNILYLKNYKGFLVEYLPLKDINFFVGDNSTGKTSIISLITSMQNNEFWNDFSNNNFREIINQNTKDTFFEIGVLTNNGVAIHIKFIENNNFPIISELKYNDSEINVFAENKDNKFSIFDQKINLKPFDFDSFRQWIAYREDGTKQSEIITNSNISIFDLLTIIKHHNIQLPELFENFLPEPPIRTEPKETYNQTDDIFSNLGDILANESSELELVNFGKKSNLFDKLKFAWLSGDIEYAIKIINKNIDLSINKVGYVISQILPLLIDLLYYKRWCISFQQPEIHLHPKAQAEFGEFIFNAAFLRDNKFIIETHSDYLIDRFRYCLHQNKSTKELDSQIVFFSKNSESDNTIQTITIMQNGEYDECLALSEFRAFFINEVAKIWEI